MSQQDDAVNRSQDLAILPLPAQLTSFIGRERELAEVKQLLASSRLVTLTGAGGCGKTRLALRVASDLRDTYADGVCWVELAPLADAASLPQAVAHALNAAEQPGRALLDVILDLLHDKRLLLVLDNCEHLARACAEFAHDALCDAPQVRILATSREPLAVTGEMLYPVAPLALPPKSQVTEIASFDSIRLFVERAQSVLPNFALTSANAQPVTDICRRLDGIPLAIELASARVNALTVEQIAARLDDRFALLTSARHGVPSHHRTLRATLDWSYSSLSAQEQTLLRRLSVFTGGCALDAVEQVCAGDGIAPEQIVDALSSLVNKSLVMAETLKPSEARYRLLETVRQYAREKLLAANEAQVYARRHQDWFLQFAEQAAPKLRGREQLEWCERLDLEIENVRAALTWSLGQTDRDSAEMTLRLAGALVWWWHIRGYWDEARTWLERSLGNGISTPARALPLAGLGLIEVHEGNRAKACPLFDEALALYRQQGDKWGIAFLASLRGDRLESDPSKASALHEETRTIAQELKDDWLAAKADLGQGNHYLVQGDLVPARSLLESGLEHARRAGDRWFIGNALVALGVIARDQGDYDRAEALLTESLEIRRELRNKNSIAGSLFLLGGIARRRRDTRHAEVLYSQAIVLLRETHHTRLIVDGLSRFGRLAAMEQRYERAARLFGSVEPLCELLGEGDRRMYEDDVRALRAQLGGAAFDKTWAEGRAMTLEQAIEYALKEEPAATSAHAPDLPRDPNALTPRETEVLRLVAAGLSDAQIATKLVISRRTVSTHLTAIYGKLGVNSRSAATRYALDRKLI